MLEKQAKQAGIIQQGSTSVSGSCNNQPFISTYSLPQVPVNTPEGPLVSSLRDVYRQTEDLHELVSRLFNILKPVISEVDGVAPAGGKDSNLEYPVAYQVEAISSNLQGVYDRLTNLYNRSRV